MQQLTSVGIRIREGRGGLEGERGERCTLERGGGAIMYG